jgi:hypothetical protein
MTLLLAILLAAQSRPDALERAMKHVKAHYRKQQLPGQIFAGFAFLMDGRCEAELKECVEWCGREIIHPEMNGNWFVAMCLFFLAEYSMKRGLTEEVRPTMEKGVARAAQEQEETGGWCHDKHMWKKTGYNKGGGGRDLGIVTSMMFGALTEMKALGVDSGTLLDKAARNLESISDGAGFRYGTDNPTPDVAMSRASYALLGLLAARRTDHPFCGRISAGLRERFPHCEKGHGYAPLHYFGVAAAMHRLGEYRRFAREVLDKLIATQDGEGVVILYNDGGKDRDPQNFKDPFASTAVFACMLMMEKEGVFVPMKRAAPGSGKPANPFSRRPK